MKTIEGNYVMCSSAGKICYTEREAGIVINGCKKHSYMGGRHWAKSSHGHSKSIPRRKYYCKDCGYFHLTHMALYNIDSRNYAWEDVFLQRIRKKTKKRSCVRSAFMGFLVLIILTGVVIAIVASSSSGNKTYSGYHDGYVRDSGVNTIPESRASQGLERRVP